MLIDPYSELGVPKSASADDIRRAYRRLAKEFHPDARPGDAAAEERFKRVTAAFNLLGDAKKRSRYDIGEIDADGNEQAPAGGHFRNRRNGGGAGDFSDIFSGMFGGERGGGPFRARGQDVRYRLSVGFVEAATGGRKRVVMGDGKALDLVLPEGVRSGQLLRLKGQGRRNRSGAPAGDALVEIDVEAHPHFSRDGDDIRLDLPITLKEAVLGAKVKAPTLTGLVTLTIPRGSNSGTILRLRGKGARGEKGRGDQLVRLIVTLPDRADEELQRFAETWRPGKGYDPRKDFSD